ncbi:glycosyltransferase family 2 protein [Rickettsiales endosymbiont of Stachyamoeba lipophora]|uniref:glycosyltransferase family 2 protein n=1 Tax=Rickettsiales endosymbiont of Stachyamoeba lipophora TaxID=2486578 RepID=UPI000F6525FB|nr:glycosyltransferase family 2 protein [Rickettsiales endosymbiont of Stachyamoeba lipophora]AZL15849.1 glycosyltransferase family 2 protein [Rickettsiales endosymbiont of Stachyamoeba lipophora]
MISVIVVSYFTGEILFESLSKLAAQELVKEVILVNNGNPKTTLTALNQLKLNKLKIITGHGNIGFAKGCNLGADQSNENHILFINPDSIIDDHLLLQKMITHLEGNHKTLMCTALITNQNGSEQRGCRRKLLTPYNIFNFNLTDTDLPLDTFQVEACSGAFMFFRKEDFMMLGKFDEHYFLHVEDIDICYKIKNAGGKISLFPQFKITHLLSTSDAPKKFVEYHKLKGLLYYFDKYFGGRIITKLIKLLLTIRFIIRFGTVKAS